MDTQSYTTTLTASLHRKLIAMLKEAITNAKQVDYQKIDSSSKKTIGELVEEEEEVLDHVILSHKTDILTETNHLLENRREWRGGRANGQTQESERSTPSEDTTAKAEGASKQG